VTLLEQLAQSVRSGRLVTYMVEWQRTRTYPLATAGDIAAAEARLGFALPALLRDIYMTISNGGFGPGYGLLGIQGGACNSIGQRKVNAIDLYEDFRAPQGSPRWPERLLPICHWGCAIYSCLDCSLPDAPVMAFEPNGEDDGPWRCDCRLHVASFAEWLAMWLRDEDLWESMQSIGETEARV
jgi:hypothetical protein